MQIEDFEGLLFINKHDLDEELVNQADVFYRVSEAHALSISEMDQAKEDLAIVDSDLDAEIRKKLTKKNKKITDKLVFASIQSHRDHAAAFEVYIAAKKLAGRFFALKDAFASRAYMLRELSHLYSTGYYTKEAIKGGDAGDISNKAKRRQINEIRNKKSKTKKKRKKVK